MRWALEQEFFTGNRQSRIISNLYMERRSDKEIKMDFNISDKSRRKVVCISNTSTDMMRNSESHHLLTVGKEYTVTKVDVREWHTAVCLEEFPGKKFNSVAFGEVGKGR